jgi:imidazole glycerol phosphate synthase subunit HisF
MGAQGLCRSTLVLPPPHHQGEVRVLSFHRLPLEQVDWQVLYGFGDRLLMQRRGWLEFVRAVTGGEIVIAQLEQDGQTAGFFSGILFRRCGVPILGSPFRGWTTAFIGFISTQTCRASRR